MASPIPFTDPSDRVAATAATRQLIEPYIELFYGRRAIRQAMEACVVADYIQHNPAIADGREAAITALEHKLADPLLHLDVQRVLVDGPYVLIHLHAWKDGERGGSVMDLYRVEDHLIVEHWDVIQQIPEQAANPHPLI